MVYQPTDIIREQYRIESIQGEGGFGTTYLATDLSNTRRVILKVLHFAKLKEWKNIELFQREATILKTLNHPRIPKYIDFFTFEQSGKKQYILVQEYIDGDNIQTLIEKKKHFSTLEVISIFIQLLEITSYIHELHPPVIHRDINPRNIIVCESNQVFLVDFGGVKEVLQFDEHMGSTIIGTPGYTALEQFNGNATIKSDLYSIAATIVFLLTHTSPCLLPVNNMKLDIDSIGDLDFRLKKVLDNFLETDQNNRTLTREQAIDILSNKSRSLSYEESYLIKSHGMPLSITENNSLRQVVKRPFLFLGTSIGGTYLILSLLLSEPELTLLGAILFVFALIVYFGFSDPRS